jgi:hypothetical protein
MTMRTSEYFSIKMDKDVPVNFPGETVSGSVNLGIKNRLKINSLALAVHGEGLVSW